MILANLGYQMLKGRNKNLADKLPEKNYDIILCFLFSKLINKNNMQCEALQNGLYGESLFITVAETSMIFLLLGICSLLSFTGKWIQSRFKPIFHKFVTYMYSFGNLQYTCIYIINYVYMYILGEGGPHFQMIRFQ